MGEIVTGEIDIFRLLIEYHVDAHLMVNLERIVDGRLLVDGKPLKEGIDKNQVYSGALIVANGGTLIERLIKDEVILDELGELRVPIPLPNEQSFLDYLSQWEEGEDGAHIFDGKHNKIRPVYHINNNPKTPKKIPPLSELMPGDFVHYDPRSISEEVSRKTKPGTKTRLAARLPHAYGHTQAYQIKRSPYTPLGFGKVTHFTRSGLTEEFFFKYEPDSKGPFINEEHSIVGIYRAYERRNGVLTRVVERVMGLSGIYGNLMLDRENSPNGYAPQEAVKSDLGALKLPR